MIKTWIRERPLVSFLLIIAVIITCAPTFARRWTTTGSALFVILYLLASASPSIAFLVVSNLIYSGTDEYSNIKARIAFLSTWLFTTGICVVVFLILEIPTIFDVRPYSNISPILTIITSGIFGLIPASVLAAAFSNRPNIRDKLSSLIKPRGKTGFYLLSVLIPLVISIASIFRYREAFDFWIPKPGDFSNLLPHLSSAIVYFIFSFIFRGGMIEETGWAGFALPRGPAGAIEQKVTVWRLPLTSAICAS